jgi:hypothetical protein
MSDHEGVDHDGLPLHKGCYAGNAREGVRMSEQERDKARALVPVERRVALMEGDEVRRVRAEDGTIYLLL